jgi:hypothetical protein
MGAFRIPQDGKLMWQRIKDYAGVGFALLVAFLGYLLTRKSQQIDKLKSDLAGEKAGEATRANDKEQENAKKTADSLESDYDALKRKYDSDRGNS